VYFTGSKLFSNAERTSQQHRTDEPESIFGSRTQRREYQHFAKHNFHSEHTDYDPKPHRRFSERLTSGREHHGYASEWIYS